MRGRAFWAGLVLVLAVVNGLVLQKERLRRSGQPVLLRLAPVDPRSLMQGDYMVLDYEVSRRIAAEEAPRRGLLVLDLDDRNVAELARIHDGTALDPDERLLRYRTVDGRVRLGAESFFFQEGHAEIYEAAQYGELRVAPSGSSLLIGLRDAELRPLGPPSGD